MIDAEAKVQALSNPVTTRIQWNLFLFAPNVPAGNESLKRGAANLFLVSFS